MLHFDRHFSACDGTANRSATEYARRNVSFVMGNSETVALEAAEFPVHWSDNACRIAASRYFSRRSSPPETSLKQAVSRITGALVGVAQKRGYMTNLDATIFGDELRWLLVHQYASFSSPVWINLGNETGRQMTSSCYILEVSDDIESLLALQTDEVIIAKGGGGAGVINSRIRASCESISNGPMAPGPLAFIRARDAWASAMRCGDVLRGFPMMEILHYAHPDIRDFIWAKAAEEKIRARVGQSYHPFFQNSNFSVRVDDAFWKKYSSNETVALKSIQGEQVVVEYRPQEILEWIAEAAYSCGDPGMQFEDNIYRWMTVDGDPSTVGTNPCAEYIWYPNSACNLASVNVVKFLREDGSIDKISLRKAVSILVTAMDLLVDLSDYPNAQIDATTKRYRNLGVGFTNLAAAVMRLGLSYDSDEARGFAVDFQSYLHFSALNQSSILSRLFGPAEGEDRDRLLDTMSLTRRCIPRDSPLVSEWDGLMSTIARFGVRNCQVTALAPTGTISLLMDCESTGIEPFNYLVTSRRLIEGDTVRLPMTSVRLALSRLGYDKTSVDRIVDHVDRFGTVYDCRPLKAKDRPVFATSSGNEEDLPPISVRGHLAMCSVLQPFVSSGISKTVNLPRGSTVRDVKNAYVEAHSMGLKSVSVYRDGSKPRQVVISCDCGE